MFDDTDNDLPPDGANSPDGGNLPNDVIDTKEDVIKRCAGILGESGPYQKARDLHIRNESVTGERNWMGLVNFRDASDHMAKIIRQLEGGILRVPKMMWRAILLSIPQRQP